NYVEPEEPDVIISMEDDTIHGGFYVELPVRSNDAPKPTADAAEQPAIPTKNVKPMEEQEEMEEHVPNISEQRQKELDALMMRMIEADWLNLMIQVGSNPTLARELLGADVNKENFIPRMNALKERKKRALADLRYRAL
nr:hypothetical protein [Tanacetum cinerariifolium]